MTDKAKPQSAARSPKAAPVRSMTGFGRVTVEDAPRVTAEIRAVNSRFLKINVKILGRYGALEDRVRTLFAELGVKRGSLDVSLFFEDAGDEAAFAINEAALKAYAEQARRLAKKHKLKGDVSLSALLPLPGVVQRRDAEQDVEPVWARARQALEAALAALNEMREREGAAAAADIRVQLAKLAEHRQALLAVAPAALQSAVQKFKDRLARLLEQSGGGAPLNPDGLEREVVLLADRLDVSEELARLESHFQQMEQTLAGGGETGKKLDFLTQELFRETNTLGSKAQDERITHRVVDMKGLIERIREQVQNLE